MRRGFVLVRKGFRRNQRGYSLLGLIFALAITAIFMTQSAHTEFAERQRDREKEFIFRGCSIAKAIARYNNGGRMAPLNPGQQLPTSLEDLTKELNINGRKLFFLRPSALLDPFTGTEWEPVRVGDPRIKEYLENWAKYTRLPLPANYVSLTSGFSVLNEGGGEGFKGGEFGPVGTGPTGDGFEESDSSSTPKRPIVGVVGRSKLPAFSSVLGKDVTYDKWLFIYGPPIPRPGQQQQPQPGQGTVVVTPENAVIIATPCDHGFIH
jgi:type II secretory pathway pseudopilin PulG